MELQKIKYIFYSFIFFILISLTSNIASPKTIWTNKKLVSFVKDKKHKQLLQNELHYIDKTYGQLISNLQKGNPIKIFLDPAHGLINGKSSARRTRRLSWNNKTEEFYSLKIVKQLYKIFQDNKHFKIITTPSLLKAINGKRKTYNDISFLNTIHRAKKNNALLIISEHLNNVKFVKRNKLILKKGIQFTKDKYGQDYLIHNGRIENGFLTLYNPYDVLSLSYNIAYYTRKEMTKFHFFPNPWGNAKVADTRFSFFNLFPASIIFESGFICNPKDEKRLISYKGQTQIALSHYKAIVKSFSTLSGYNLFIKGNLVKNKLYNPKKLKLKISLLKKMRTIHLLVRTSKLIKSKILLLSLLKSKYLKLADRKNSLKLFRDIKYIINKTKKAKKITQKFNTYSFSKTISEGVRTFDIKGDAPEAIGTNQMGEEIVKRL
jgi:N-acetylmuramoyl-L-alanine amidase/uncharacterized protein YktA (UPF0223 family)